MRTWDIVDTASGAVLRQETVEDTIRPTLLAGEKARAAELAIQGEVLNLTDEQRAVMGQLQSLAPGQPVEYANGVSDVRGLPGDDRNPTVHDVRTEPAAEAAAVDEGRAG